MPPLVAVVAESGLLDNVVKRIFTTSGYRLESGRVLPEMALAYDTWRSTRSSVTRPAAPSGRSGVPR